MKGSKNITTVLDKPYIQTDQRTATGVSQRGYFRKSILGENSCT